MMIMMSIPPLYCNAESTESVSFSVSVCESLFMTKLSVLIMAVIDALCEDTSYLHLLSNTNVTLYPEWKYGVIQLQYTL